MNKRTVAIVGCGAIGRAIAKAFSEGRLPGRVVAVCDSSPEAAERMAASIRPTPHVATVEGAVRLANVVVECASVNAVDSVVRAAAKHHRNVVVMSEIGLLNHPGLFDVVRRSGISLAVPSGALAGLDALRAASGARLKSVTLTTRKPPAGLESAPYVVRRGLKLRKLKKPMVLYSGNVIGAAKGFPANINVAAGCAMAGIGPKATRVCIIADPTTKVNSHTIEYEGEFGRAVCRVENRPFPDNPKTSYLAALSAISALRRMLEGIGIGG
jgi:aspartate dehydrogenase